MRCVRGLASLGPRNLALVQRARLAIMPLAGILHNASTCMRFTGAGDPGPVEATRRYYHSMRYRYLVAAPAASERKAPRCGDTKRRQHAELPRNKRSGACPKNAKIWRRRRISPSRRISGT